MKFKWSTILKIMLFVKPLAMPDGTISDSGEDLERCKCKSFSWISEQSLSPTVRTF